MFFPQESADSNLTEKSGGDGSASDGQLHTTVADGCQEVSLEVHGRTSGL